jgi:pimeloyl-ACP methyl ester carboxylesterase
VYAGGEIVAMSQELVVEDHYFEAATGKIHYTTSGSGAPLFLFHWMAGSGEMWTQSGVLPILSESFRCYTIDSPGNGKSDIPRRQFFVDEVADCMVALMDSAGVERAHLLGHHGGSLLALSIAARHSRRVSKVVLNDPVYYDSVGGLEFFRNRVSDPDYKKLDFDTYDRPVDEKLTWEQAKTRTTAHYQGGYGMTQEEWEAGADLREQKRYWWRLWNDSAFSYNVVAIIARVVAPVLILSASPEQDPLGNRKFSIPLHRALLNSRHIPDFDDVQRMLGPTPLVTSPDRFCRTVIEFLNE